MNDQTPQTQPPIAAARLSPLPVRITVWIVLGITAVLAIALIDRHAIALQEQGAIKAQKNKTHAAPRP